MKRLGLGVVDQGVSSAVQALVLFGFAHVADVRTLGQYSLLVLLFTIAQASVRGFLGTPIALAAPDRSALEAETERAQLLALLIGGVALLCILIAAQAFDLGTWSVWVAIAAPVVLVQDVLRFHAMAAGRPGVALLSDSAWAAGTTAMLVGTWTDQLDSEQTVIVIWAGSGLLALLLIAATLPVVPSARGLLPWVRADLPRRLRYAGEGFLAAATTAVVLVSAALLVSVEASGALRVTSALFAPMVIMLQAIPLALVPELRRRGLVTHRQSWPLLAQLGLAASAVSLISGLVLWLSPWGLGPLLLGDSWELSRPLVLVTALNYAFVAWMHLVGAGLRARDDAVGLLRNRMLFATSSIALGALAGVWPGTALAVATALTLAAALSALAAVQRQALGT